MVVADENNRTSMPGNVSVLVFAALFWSAATLLFDGFLASRMFQQIQATTYPTVPGEVTHSEVATVEDDDGALFRPKIRYIYAVQGKQYTRGRYRYGQFSVSDGSAHRIVAAYPVGRQVEVHYNPADPTDAVLLAGLDGSDLLVAMFMLPFNLAMLYLWGIAGRALFRRAFSSPAGRANVREEGRCLRVRLCRWKPLGTGLVTAGGLAFLLMFVVGFSMGLSPPLPAMHVAWGLILGGGLAGWGYQRWKLARGDYDLVIDDFRQTLTLPRTFGRQERVVVSADRIVSIEVERTEKRDSDGDVSHSFVPTLLVTGDDETTRREKLIDSWDEASAEGLTAWLRKRLRIEPEQSESR